MSIFSCFRKKNPPASLVTVVARQPTRLCAICNERDRVRKSWNGKFAHNECIERVLSSETIIWGRLNKMRLVTLAKKYAIHDRVQQELREFFKADCLSTALNSTSEEEICTFYKKVNIVDIRNEIWT